MNDPRPYNQNKCKNSDGNRFVISVELKKAVLATETFF
jgi:hypothetical protein